MSEVNIVGEQADNKCGYCKTGGSASFGLVCDRMRVRDYEDLMLKGWRRCGNYYYKPNLRKSCCKLNTIRLNAEKFVANKSQKKVLKKFDKYVSGVEKKIKNKSEKRQILKEILKVPEELEGRVKNAVRLACEELGVEFGDKLCSIKRNRPNREEKFGHYSISSALAINAKLKGNLADISKILENRILENIDGTQWHIFSIDKGFINLVEEGVKKIEIPEESGMALEIHPHMYEFSLVNDDFSEESFKVYKEYQIAVHKDPPNKITRDGYTSFLCKSSLIRESPTQEYPSGLGSFHMLHRLDGRLVAVSVLDILPSGLSAVYFFYSPDITFLSPGVFSAVKEIEFCQKNLSKNFKFYYMGFYVDTCPKMRYKGEYHPSELLCPEKYVWVPIEDCVANKSHGFLELASCSPITNNLPKNPEMDFSGLNISNFVIQNAKISLSRQIHAITDLNPRGMAIVLQILTEAAPQFGKSLFKRLIYSFG